MKNEIITSIILKFQEYVGGLKKSEAATDEFANTSLKNLQEELAKVKKAQSEAFGTESAQSYQKNIDAIEDKISRFKQSISGMGEEVAKGGGIAKKGIETLQGGLGGLMTTFVGGALGGAAANVFTQIGHQAYEAAKEIDAAEDRMTIALTKTKLSASEQSEEFDRLGEVAEKLSEDFARPKGEIQALQNTIISFSGKTGKELDELTELSIGAADAMGMSAEGVARIIAKGADENGGSLARFNIHVDKNATAAQRAAIIQEKFGASIKASKEAADDAFGSFDKIKNTLFEGLGKVALVILNLIKPALDIFFEALKPVMGLLDTLLAILKPVIAVIGFLAKAFNGLTMLPFNLIKSFGKWISHLGFVKDAIKAVKDTVAEVIDWFDKLIEKVKEAPAFLLSLIGVTEDVKTAEEERTEAVEKLTQALADAKEANEAFKKTYEGFDDIINDNIDTLTRQEIYIKQGGFLKDGKFVKLSQEQIEEFKKSNAAIRKELPAYASLLKQKKTIEEGFKKEFSTDPDAKKDTKKEAKGEDPFKKEIDKLQNELKQKQLAEDLSYLTGKQSKDKAETEKLNLIATYNDKLRDVAKSFHKDTIEFEKNAAEARLQIIENARKREEEEYKKKGEDLQKTLEGQANIMRNVASLLGNDPLDVEASIIRDNLSAQLKYLQDGLEAGQITQEQYNAQNFKLYKDSDKALADLDTKRIDRTKELADLRAELIDDETDSAIAKLDAQFNSENAKIQADYDNKVIMADVYEAKKELIAKKYAKDRGRIVEDALKKENILYKASAGLISSVFTKLTDSLKSALGKFFGWNKENVQKKTDNDIALEKFETDKKLSEIDRQVQTSQISYEEGLLRKQALKEQERKQEEEHVSAMAALGQSFVDTTIGQLGQLAESYVQQALIQLATKQTESTGNLIASIFSTIPFPLNTILAAGAFGLVAGLFSGLLSGTEEQKNSIEKRAAGGFVKGGQQYTVNELGQEGYIPLTGGQHTFLAPEDGYILPHDASKRQGSGLGDLSRAWKEFIKRSLRIGSFANYGDNGDVAKPSKFNKNFENIYKNNSIIPTTAPTLSPNYNAGQQQMAIAQLQQAVKDLRSGGIDLHITMENIQRGEDLYGAVKSYEVGVDRRAYVNNMG